jgi:hypothetical protein
MAEKKAAKPAAKPAAKKTMSKGDAYLCEVCGLQVNVDICGEFLESKGLHCCGKAMQKAAK